MIAVAAGCFTTWIRGGAITAAAIVPDHGWRPLFHLSYFAVIVAALNDRVFRVSGYLAKPWPPGEAINLWTSSTRHCDHPIGRAHGLLLASSRRREPTRIRVLWRREYLKRTVVSPSCTCFFSSCLCGELLAGVVLVLHGCRWSRLLYAIEQRWRPQWVDSHSGGSWTDDKYVTLMIAFCWAGSVWCCFSVSTARGALFAQRLVGALMHRRPKHSAHLVTDTYRPRFARRSRLALGIGRLGGLLGRLSAATCCTYSCRSRSISLSSPCPPLLCSSP